MLIQDLGLTNKQALIAALERQLLVPRSSSGISFPGGCSGAPNARISERQRIFKPVPRANRSTTSVTAGRLPAAAVRYSASLRSNVPRRRNDRRRVPAIGGDDRVAGVAGGAIAISNVAPGKNACNGKRPNKLL